MKRLTWAALKGARDGNVPRVPVVATPSAPPPFDFRKRLLKIYIVTRLPGIDGYPTALAPMLCRPPLLTSLDPPMKVGKPRTRFAVHSALGL